MAQLLVFSSSCSTPLLGHLRTLGVTAPPHRVVGLPLNLPGLPTVATYHEGPVESAFYTGLTTGVFTRTVRWFHHLLTPSQQDGYCELLDVPALEARALRRWMLLTELEHPSHLRPEQAFLFDGRALTPLFPPVLALPDRRVSDARARARTATPPDAPLASPPAEWPS